MAKKNLFNNVRAVFEPTKVWAVACESPVDYGVAKGIIAVYTNKSVAEFVARTLNDEYDHETAFDYGDHYYVVEMPMDANPDKLRGRYSNEPQPAFSVNYYE